VSAVVNWREQYPTFDAAIEAVGQQIAAMPQDPLPVRHIFAPGVYMREMTAKKGYVIVGHKHRTEHLNRMPTGALRFLNDDGTTTDLHGPVEFWAPPGRKVAITLEDTVFINVHETDETDVEAIEALFLDKSPMPQKLVTYQPDGDYEVMLQDIGASAELVRRISEVEDVVPFPFGSYKVKIGTSDIEGRGLICTADIAKDEVICHMRIGDRRTLAGRYTNHSGAPNARIIDQGADAYLMSLRDIEGCRGGFDGEEITVDYRQINRRLLESLV